MDENQMFTLVGLFHCLERFLLLLAALPPRTFLLMDFALAAFAFKGSLTPPAASPAPAAAFGLEENSDKSRSYISCCSSCALMNMSPLRLPRAVKFLLPCINR